MNKMNLSFLMKSRPQKLLMAGLLMIFFFCFGSQVNAQNVLPTAKHAKEVIEILKKHDGKYVSNAIALQILAQEKALLSAQVPSTMDEEIELSLKFTFINSMKANLNGTNTVDQALFLAYGAVSAKINTFKSTPVTALELFDFYTEKFSN